eukprot:CAMPEP_0194736876 /NCGR_PEP_ID=MMETSP0296-20130528/79079_1 /TAXON_ID=39354 /ORGANISM="Heterosigma akashiwo, Strain CCMP2393" /LENGTH=63 /DNA_ID=CAMNT_0039646607 /DNA_START=240 /DNA_END=431 /DNA_ORIENTATION=+
MQIPHSVLVPVVPDSSSSKEGLEGMTIPGLLKAVKVKAVTVDVRVKIPMIPIAKCMWNAKRMR